MNGQLVKSLLVEIDASTEKLRRALREGGVELDTFAQKSERTGKTSSTASEAVGSKSAMAARQIAMTTETIARQGQVSGEAAKQLIAQASNAAFAFGPTGALVGAIGVATLAIGTMFARTKREMQEAIDKAREARNEFSEMDAVGQARAINQLARGRLSDDAVLSTAQIMERPEDDRSELFRQRGINRLRDDESRLLAEARRAAATPGRRDANAIAASRARVAELAAVRAALAELGDEYGRYTKELTATAAAEAATTQTGLQQAKQAEAAKDALRERTQAEREADRLRQQREERLLQAQDAMHARMRTVMRDGFTGTTEDIKQAFDEMVAYAQQHGGVDVPFLVRARDRALEFNAALERSRELVGRVEMSALQDSIVATDTRDRSGPWESVIQGLEGERNRFTTIANDIRRTSRERAAALEEVRRIQAEIVRLVERESAERRRGRAELIAQAQAIGQMLDGVLQMAGAWGNVRREVVDTLRGIVQIGANVPNVLDKLDALDAARAAAAAGKVGKGIESVGGAMAGVAGAALPIIGALSTIGAQLFGDSPAEQERKRVQRENTRAIERLTRQMSVNINVAGADWIRTRAELQELMGGEMRARSWTQLNAEAFRRMGGREGLDQLIARGSRFSLSEFSDAARIDWRQMGDIDRDLLEQTAKELDVTLDGTVGSFRRLMDAIAAAEGKLFEFGDTYEDQVVLTDLEIQAKRITDPLERTLAKLGPALENSPLLKDLIANADLSSEAGRAALRDSILQILETMDAGGDALDAEQVGLTRDQFLEVLGFLLGSLDDLDTQAAGGQGSSLGGVSGFRGLTEAAGERMADYLRGILGQGGEQLQVMRAQLAELARIAATPFTLPAIPGVTVPMPVSAAGTTFTFASGAISIGDVVVQVSGSTTDPAGLGLQVTQAVRDQVEELLYQSLSRALRVRGDVSIIPGVR